MECQQYKNITLQDYQKKLIDFISKPEQKGVLVFHSLGSGKTITSLAAARCISRYKKVQVVTNASLVNNFTKEIKKLELNKEKRIFVDSYGKFLNKKKSCTDTILILDESQGMNGDNSVRFKKIFECAKEAPKVILLSATPIKNSPSEFAKQMSLASGKKISKSDIEVIDSLGDQRLKNKAYKKIMGCNVSYFKTDSSSDSEYPTVKKYVVSVKMDKRYYDDYYKIQQRVNTKGLPDIFSGSANLAVFYNGIRRAVNKIRDVSPKVDWAVEKIISEVKAGRKVLLYSNWLETGILAVKRKLFEAGVPVSEVSGKMALKQKNDSVSRYNKGANKVILISSSGAEGLNLKETRTVIILEPHWNSSKIDQVIGRSVRYKSHSKLPESERTVDVYNLLLLKDENLKNNLDIAPSADQILFEMSIFKNQSINSFYDLVIANSIENNPECIQ